MEKLIVNIKSILEKVDFNAIWQGFVPCDFALFDQNTVYMHDRQIPRDNRFMGNTAIIFEDKPLAIWYVENPNMEDTELLASGLVHEMFHAFQKQQGESRYPNEFSIFAYPQILENYQLKQAENHYLSKAFAENSLMDLEQFVTLRRARGHIIGDIIQQEMLCETEEGMAEYAGLMALSQINRSKFMENIEHHMICLRNPDDLFNIRRISYSVGCIMCLTMKSIGINFHHQLSDSRMLFDFIPAGKNPVEVRFKQFKHERQRQFDEFLASHNEKIGCDTQITGFDPMNMVRLGDKILCSRFVMLDGEFIQGPVMLEMAEGSLHKVVGYIK